MVDYEAKHDQVLDDLVMRLIRKPGFLFIKQEYIAQTPRGDKVNGEMDVMYLNRRHGKTYKRYYEVKSRHSDLAYERSMKQFVRHRSGHFGESWKYIYVTPTKIERIRL